MTDPHLSVDTLFELLKNRRRRYLLYALDQNADSVVTLDELTALVLDWEQRTNGGLERPFDELESQIRIELHHNHLPKIAEFDLVEYDPRSETVRNRGVPSIFSFVEESHEEVPHLRSLFAMSATG